MRIIFSPRAFEQYVDWQREDAKLTQRINELILETRRTPFTGIGKPEPLRGELQGWWSRRITQEHRLVYRVTGKAPDQVLEIAACRFH
ncbi:MAG: Txe/YoeB family addiction module toxin, partial [Bosea sp. (in: a-proteobacteria)]